MKTKNIVFSAAILFFMTGFGVYGQITVRSLIEEMTDMEALTRYPEYNYRVEQLSSYDRRSDLPQGKGWNANSDGFGNEPIPAVNAVLRGPDENGIGEYLLDHIEGPGAIVRMWIAERMGGQIRVFLDHELEPVFEGNPKDFFQYCFKHFSQKANMDTMMFENTFLQRDACYLPIPFARSCSIVWEGDLGKLHFRQIQFRRYPFGTDVVTFSPEELKKAEDAIQKASKLLADPQGSWAYTGEAAALKARLNPGQKKLVWETAGAKAVEKLVLKLEADNLTDALRQTVMYIQFDDYHLPQVQCPVGDFFGTGPGVNPYNSIAATVETDGTMTCRFVMPFKENMRIWMRNFGEQRVRMTGSVLTKDYEWDPVRSMYFFARWRIDYDLLTHDPGTMDVPYIITMGKGCFVGAAMMLLNSSSVPTIPGSWWGEGDEKIFVDCERFPSTFGTGSEDYFNYSWSSNDIFDYAYCGQTRNDGPANRGFVSDFRWQIVDRMPFDKSLAFYMELWPHDPVGGFAYGRIGYYYAMPGAIDDHVFITGEDVRVPQLPAEWKPEAKFGAEGCTFLEAEDILVSMPESASLVEDPLWSGGKMLAFRPESSDEMLEFRFAVPEEGKYTIFLTGARTPDSGIIVPMVDGKDLPLGGRKTYDFKIDYGTRSRMIYAVNIPLSEGEHTITVRNENAGEGTMLGLDFFWYRKK